MSQEPGPSRAELLREVEELRARLQEAEDVLRAIGSGQVDAIMVTGNEGDQVALILTPASEAPPDSHRIASSKHSRFVAKSVRIGEVDQFVRASRAQGQGGLLLGISPLAKQLQQIVESAANNDSTILLQGETGTGKNVIARWIYEHSSRSRSAFVEINCASLKGELLANELFGHERGAFTSAMENKLGLLDVANGGTLFLDEIGDMDPGVQAQFLKVLEEKTFRRLGSVTQQKSEFRLICASNRNLGEETNKGTFRKDLYYRIHVFPIDVPPLRQRPEDIPAFANLLLQTLGASNTSLDSNVLRMLQIYQWPGNIRELRNVLERALLLAKSNQLRKEHFPGLEISETMMRENGSDRERITQVLKQVKGNKKKAAELLGISRVTLYRKLKPDRN